MTVKAFAESIDKPVEDVLRVSGKKSEKAMMSDDLQSEVIEVLSAEEAEAAEAAKAADTKPELNPGRDGKEPDIVRFWSDVMKLMFYVHNPATGQDVAVKFQDYRLVVEKDTIVYKAIIGLKEPGVRVIVDEPFKDIVKKTEFRDMLDKAVYTGPHREASAYRGMNFLNALFTSEDAAEVARTFQTAGPSGLIQYAVDNKSFITVSELK